MNILNKLTLRSLKLNRKRTVVTIIGIILSGAMICGVATIAASFQDLFIQSAIDSDGNYHATFYDVPLDQIKYITGNPYTGSYMFSRDAGFAPFAETKNDHKPYFLIKEYDRTAFEHMPVTLKEGRFPEKEGEAVISEEIFAIGGSAYAIGQTVTLEASRRVDGDSALTYEPYSETETLQPLTVQTYTITGLIEKPRFESFSSVPGHTVIAYLSEKSAAAAGAVNVSILGKKPRDIYEKVPELAAAAGVEKYQYNNELLRWMGISGNDNFIRVFNTIVLIIILLVVVGSVAVIYNAFAISVSERKKQFGMLASVGATPRQIRKSVFFEGVVLGLIGLPLGILSGIGGIGVTLSVVNDLIIGSLVNENLALRLVVPPQVILVTIVFVALVIFLSAYLPARKAAAVAPIEAIHLSTDIQIKGKQLRTSRLTRFLFGVEGELALKNLKRNRKRYRATVFSLFISIVLFVSFSSFMNYGLKSAEMYYGDVPFDVQVSLYDATFEDQKELFRQIAALEGIKRSATVRVITSQAEGIAYSRLDQYYREYYVDQGLVEVNEDGSYNIQFMIAGLDHNSFNHYAQELGLDAADFNSTENFQGILINRNYLEGSKRIEYEPLQVKAGERLRLVDYQYEEEHQPATYDLTIGAVTDQLPFGLSYSSAGYIYVVVPEPAFEAIRELLHENMQQQADLIQMFFQAADSTALVEQVRALHGDDSEGSLSIFDIASATESMRRTRLVLSIFLYGFVTLITLIGVTNIFNTINTNVALRRREFAMLKSMGLTPKGFNRIIAYESIFYGLKALAYGLPAAALVSVWMFNAIGNMFEFTFFLPLREMAYCVAGVLIIVSVTMLHASARLKKENIIDALRQENL